MLQVSNIKYTAPKVDIVEFGNEDVCTSSAGWVVIGPDGKPSGGGDIIQEGPGHEYGDGDF